MKKRAEWITCIAETHRDRWGKSLCGRKVGFVVEVNGKDELRLSEFCFVDICHWLHNREIKGRLVGCPECLGRITKTMDKEIGDQKS